MLAKDSMKIAKEAFEQYKVSGNEDDRRRTEIWFVSVMSEELERIRKELRGIKYAIEDLAEKKVK